MNPDALFHSNPPTDIVALREVFIGRKRELERLGKYLPSSVSGVIRAIHGGSRVGKSHLTLRFLQEKEKDFHVFIVQAAEGKKARLILQDLYEKVRNAVLNIENPILLEKEEVSSAGILEQARHMIHMTDQLMLDGHSSREISVANSYKASAGFKILANLLGLSAELSSADEESNSVTTKITASAPSDHRIVDFVHELCEVLYHTTAKKSVIYIDDVDLLDMGSDDDHEQVTALIRLLHRLSESDHISIIASMRTRHMTIGQKALSELIHVAPMRDSEIEQVYWQHVNLFNDKQALFDSDCLKELVASSALQIGTFLRTCRRFLAWAEYEGLTDNARQLTKDDLATFYRLTVAELRRNPNHREYIDQIYAAVQANQLIVNLDPAVLRTELVYTLLEEPLGSGIPRNYVINQMVATVIRQEKPT